jgi:hypothetical protein
MAGRVGEGKPPHGCPLGLAGVAGGVRRESFGSSFANLAKLLPAIPDRHHSASPGVAPRTDFRSTYADVAFARKHRRMGSN